VLLPLLVAPVAAQDDVLIVERPEDLRAYAAAVRQLQRVRADFNIEAASPRELCRLFGTLAGEQLPFSCAVKDDEAGEPVTLHLKQATLWAAMVASQLQTEHRFVFRAGVVFLLPKSRVQQFRITAIYDLRPQCAPVRNFPGPRLGLRGLEEQAEDEAAEESTTTVSGFTAEGIETLIREHVTPEQWGNDGVSISNDNGLFVVRHSLSGHRELRRLLDTLGLLPLPRVVRAGRR
jgi:hypothetical protein